MESQLAELPDDVAILKRIIITQAEEAQRLVARHTAQHEEITRLKLELLAAQEKYAALQRRFFGSSSEKTRENPKQMLLFNEAETYANEPPPAPKVKVAAHERLKRGRKPLPEHVPRNEIVHALSEEERRCPSCGSLRPEIGEERREEVRVIPAKTVIDVHVMKKYGPCSCTSCHGTDGQPIIQAAGPAKIVPGSRFSNSTIAFFLASKYVDHQPFYRMEGILSRFGIETSRATLCGLAISAGRAIGDLVEAIKEAIKASEVVQMDETPVQVLHERGRSAQQGSYMWVARGFSEGKPLCLFHYHQSRSKEVANGFLAGYRGFVQTDGYGGYDDVGNWPGVVHVGCLAHVRRKFYEAAKAGSEEATHFLAMVAELYHEEHALRQAFSSRQLTKDAFLAQRQTLQKPKLEAMRAWLVAREGRSPPSLAFGKAVHYALGQWPRIERYLEHDLLTPDTNAIEQAIRPFALGRKNWLFSNTPLGAHASAGIYSLIETAKANGHEPYRYLCYLFDELPKRKTREEKLALLPYRLAPDAY
jgi:transposase